MMGERDLHKVTSGYQGIKIDEQRPRHRVELSRSYYLSQHEVTRGQFKEFVAATDFVTDAERDNRGAYHLIAPNGDYKRTPEINWRNPGFEQKDDHPVVAVSWNDAQAFCRWLSQTEQKTYRLPTEAEWERACRGLTLTSWCSGNEKYAVKTHGNVADKSIRQHYRFYGVAAGWDDGHVYSSPVGSFLPNSFGLYDMHGNVYEWCQDWFSSDYYKSSSVVDPQGPATGALRVQRGGSFLHHFENSRSAHRDYGDPTEAASCLGFRVLLEREPTEGKVE